MFQTSAVRRLSKAVAPVGRGSIRGAAMTGMSHAGSVACPRGYQSGIPVTSSLEANPQTGSGPGSPATLGATINRLHCWLPGGWLFTVGMSKLAIGTLPEPGWTDTYAVVGGTGTYAGARGTERLTLPEDGTTYKTVITLLPW